MAVDERAIERARQGQALVAAIERVRGEVARVQSFRPESTTKRLWIANDLADAAADLVDVLDLIVQDAD